MTLLSRVLSIFRESYVFLGDGASVDFADLELCAAEVANELWKHISSHEHRSATVAPVSGYIIPEIVTSAFHAPAGEMSGWLAVGIVDFPKSRQLILVGNVRIAHYCFLSRGVGCV